MQKYLRPEFLLLHGSPHTHLFPGDAESRFWVRKGVPLHSLLGKITVAISYHRRNIHSLEKDCEAGILQDYHENNYHDVTTQVYHYLCNNHLLRG